MVFHTPTKKKSMCLNNMRKDLDGVDGVIDALGKDHVSDETCVRSAQQVALFDN